MLNFLRSLNPWPKCVVCGRPAPTGSDLCLAHRGQTVPSPAGDSNPSYAGSESGEISLPEVICPVCAATVNSSVAPFCTNCGSALLMSGPGHAQSGPDTDLASRQELQDEINELRTLLRNASGRLHYIQRRIDRLDAETETPAPQSIALAAPSQAQPEPDVADPEQAAVDGDSISHAIGSCSRPSASNGSASPGRRR